MRVPSPRTLSAAAELRPLGARRAAARVDLDDVGVRRARSRPRAGRGARRAPNGWFFSRLPVPPPPAVPPFSSTRFSELSSVGDVRVAGEDGDRGRRAGSARSSSIAGSASAGSCIITTSTLPTSGLQPVGERALLRPPGRLVAAIAVAVAAAALVRVGVARDAQPVDLARRPCRTARPGSSCPRSVEHDRAGLGEVAGEHVGVVVARHEHERVADVGDPPREPRLERRAARGEVAGEEQRAAPHGALERGQREQVVVQVRGEREVVRARRPAPRCAGAAISRARPTSWAFSSSEIVAADALGLVDRAQRRRGCRGRWRSTPGRRSRRAGATGGRRAATTVSGAGDRRGQRQPRGTDRARSASGDQRAERERRQAATGSAAGCSRRSRPRPRRAAVDVEGRRRRRPARPRPGRRAQVEREPRRAAGPRPGTAHPSPRAGRRGPARPRGRDAVEIRTVPIERSRSTANDGQRTRRGGPGGDEARASDGEHAANGHAHDARCICPARRVES